MLASDNNSYFPTIQIIENNTLIPDEKNKINDLDIKKGISIIDNTVANSAMIGKNLKNGTELVNNNRAFFFSSKKRTENMQAVGKTGKVYGTQMVKDTSSNRMLYDKQTVFTKEDVLVKNAGKDALINAGFNTASMIVGQYYMNEINNKLDDLKEEINVISDYLDSDYKSRLSYIVSKIKEITENKLEILSNDFSTDKRYDEILELESDCAELLGQANEMMKNNISKKDIDYSKYEKKLKEIYKWFSRQQILQVLLLEIGNLRYVLAKGNETSKLSHTQYNNYLLQSNNINEELKQWHDVISKKLEPYINNKQDEIIKIQKYNGEYYNLLGDGNNN